MTYKETLLKNKNNTVLSYVGAALLGAVLSVMFHLITGGQLLLGVSAYIGYIVVVLFMDNLAKRGIKWACEFNELWITIESLTKKKLGI